LLSGTRRGVPPLYLAQDGFSIRPPSPEEPLQEPPFTRRNDLSIHSYFVLTALPGRHRRLEPQTFLNQRHETRGTIPVASGLTVDDLNMHVSLLLSVGRTRRPFWYDAPLPSRRSLQIDLTVIDCPVER
jgi:hypothetical protein